jgi:hypothetical protein
LEIWRRSSHPSQIALIFPCFPGIAFRIDMPGFSLGFVHHRSI